MNAGLGNPDKIAWTQAALAAAAGVGDNTIGRWLSRKPTLPSPPQFKLVFEALFTNREARAAPEAKALLSAFETVRSAKNLKPVSANAADQPAFSLRQVWNAVLKTRVGEFENIAVGGSKSPDPGMSGYAAGELQLVDSGESFILPVPETLRSTIVSGDIPYDLHGEGAEISDAALSDVVKALPGYDLLSQIDKHAQAYAQRVIAAFGSPLVTTKPYNKKKFGVRSCHSYTIPGEAERVGTRFELFQTDYFTNWVMSRVLDDLRLEHPDWLAEGSRFPALSVGTSQVYVPQLACALSLACFVIAQPPLESPSLCFTRLARASKNRVQHGKLHIPLNEALNLDYMDDDTDKPSLGLWWQRMVVEEIGYGADVDRFRFKPISVFLDSAVHEFSIFGIITTDYSVDELNQMRNTTSGDRPLEFQGDLIDVPASEPALIQFALGQRRSISEFVTYTPHLIDHLLQLGMLSRT